MTTLTAEKPQTQTTEIHTCCECGKTGPGMVANYYYVGGQGDILVYECEDCINDRLQASQKAVQALKMSMMLRTWGDTFPTWKE